MSKQVQASKDQKELWKTGGEAQERKESVRRFEKRTSGKQQEARQQKIPARTGQRQNAGIRPCHGIYVITQRTYHLNCTSDLPHRTIIILYCTSQRQCPTISPTLASLICLKEGRQKMQKMLKQWKADSAEAARAKRCSVLNHQQVVSVLDCAWSVGTHPGAIATSDV